MIEKDFFALVEAAEIFFVRDFQMLTARAFRRGRH
jgi:hypothetical protein